MTTPSRPGLFIANSKITSPTFSHETFTKWYDQVHIPDIFTISKSFKEGTGIISAFRYYSATPQTPTKKPYLAIYPLEDIGYLETQEFWSIPVTSEILDEATGQKETKCFELVEFDMLPYELVKVVELKTVCKGPAPFLITLQFATPDSDVENLPFLPVRDGIRRTRLYKTHWTEKNSLPHQRSPPIVPEYIALIEVESELMAEAFEASKDAFEAEVSVFKLVCAFGETEVVY